MAWFKKKKKMSTKSRDRKIKKLARRGKVVVVSSGKRKR